MEHSTDKGHDLQRALTAQLVPGVVTPGWFDFRPLAVPHAVTGRERQALSGGLGLRRIVEIRDGGVPRHPPGWRPRLPRCIEGCRLWSGLAELGGSPNVGICLTPSATRLSRHVRRSPSNSSICRLDGSPPGADRPAHTLDRSAVRDPAPLVGAIYPMRGVHHGSDLSERNTILVQVGVYVLGNVVWRPTPPEIVADEVCHPDEGLLVARRPSEAGTT